ELLILDEPTNGLDPAGIKELREHLKRLAYEENVAILVSSHLLNEMELMCDRFAIIQNGRFVETKTIAELQLTEERIVHLEVDNFEEAQKVIEKYWQDKGLPRRTLTKSAENNHLDVHLDREDCPEIIRLLVENKLKVYRLEPDKLTLEDNFLEITKGEGIV
ncbi:MAG: ABC transporter ATP-binding protein, partial [Spirochaetota bacterium]|nr:ABC transporter ATP-binding protein [Spirochaetota bacterium]